MNDDPHKNEWDDLVRRAHGYHIRPFTPGEKAGVLWAEAELTALHADVVRLMADIVTGDNRVAELMEVIRWAHDVAIYDDEYPGKNARLRRELLQKAKMVIKL